MKATPTWHGDLPRAEMLQFIPERAYRILDVGCNCGAFGELIKNTRDAELWGVEPNIESAELAKLRLDRVIQDSFHTETEVPSGYFDVVVMNDVLEHMVDPWSALELAATKLTVGGSIVASLPNLLHVDNLLHILVERDFRYEPNGIRDSTHLRFFTKKSALRLFGEAGLNVTRIDGINASYWTPSIVRRLAFRLFRGFLDEAKYIQFAIVGQPNRTAGVVP